MYEVVVFNSNSKITVTTIFVSEKSTAKNYVYEIYGM